MAQHQRKGRRQASSSGIKPFYVILGVIAVVGIAALAWVALRGRTGKMATQPVDLSAIKDPKALYQKARPEVIGDTTAPVKMVVFVDYMCPHCAEFDTEVLPGLEQKYVTNGTLQVAVYDFPLGGAFVHSFLVARAAHCADAQGKFRAFSSTLFSRQPEWSGSPNDAAVIKYLMGYAKQLGLDTSTFESCVRSQQYADVVTANRMLGEDLGVNSTPTVIVDGRQIADPMDVASLDSLISQSAGK